MKHKRIAVFLISFVVLCCISVWMVQDRSKSFASLFFLSLLFVSAISALLTSRVVDRLLQKKTASVLLLGACLSFSMFLIATLAIKRIDQFFQYPMTYISKECTADQVLSKEKGEKECVLPLLAGTFDQMPYSQPTITLGVDCASGSCKRKIYVSGFEFFRDRSIPDNKVSAVRVLFHGHMGGLDGVRCLDLGNGVHSVKLVMYDMESRSSFNMTCHADGLSGKIRFEDAQDYMKFCLALRNSGMVTWDDSFNKECVLEDVGLSFY